MQMEIFYEQNFVLQLLRLKKRQELKYKIVLLANLI